MRWSFIIALLASAAWPSVAPAHDLSDADEVARWEGPIKSGGLQVD